MTGPRIGVGVRCAGLWLLAWLSLGVVRTVQADELIDRVLAVAGGEVILLSDVRAARDLGLVAVPSTGDPTRAILSALIDRALMLDEVRRYAPPEPSVAAVDRALAAARQRMASEQAFTAALARSGLDERRLREGLRQDLRIRAYLDQRFNGDSPDRVRASIDEWLAGLRRRGEIVDLYTAPVS